MSGIQDWPRAFSDRRFWANRYGYDATFIALFQISLEEANTYYYHMMECEDYPEELYELEPECEGSTFTLTFPEDFSWRIEFVPEGTFHTIFHPHFYPDGAFLAAESGCSHLPGLRWAELKQIENCLRQHWHESFDVKTIFPLLYPVVTWITFDELSDVRRTLSEAWEALHVLEHSHLNRLLDKTLQVYEGGIVLSYDSSRGWYNPSRNPSSATGEELWLYAPTLGWYTNGKGRPRNLHSNPELFLPFFSMLEQFS